MPHLHVLIIIDVSAAAFLFAVTWGSTRKLPWLAQSLAAVVGWVILSFIEALAWGLLQIDNYYPRPESPWLVPANVIFGALWLVVVTSSLSRRMRPNINRAAAVTLGLLVAAGALAAIMWPSEAQMSHSCADHLHNQWLALHWYAEKHEGKLPPMAGTGWARLTSPYYTYRPDLLRCPADKGNGDTSYLLTLQAAGKSLNKLGDETILLMENKARHHAKAHALLADGEIIAVDAHSGHALNPKP